MKPSTITKETQLTPDQEVRFWSKVSHPRLDSDCWNWSASKNNMGYGQIRFWGKTFTAHRIAWLIANGPIPSDICICHRCDNPACVNPSHLFLGTQTDNLHDMIAKRRHGSHLHPERRPRGEAHKRAKLTDSEVIGIRDCYKAGGISQSKIAAQYGVTRSAISLITRRKKWTHI